MEKLNPVALIAGFIVVGVTVNILENTNRSAAWLLVGIVLLSVLVVTPGAPARFAAAVNAVRSQVFSS